MKLSKHFSLKELVSPETFQKFGNSSIWFVDRAIVDVLEIIRTRINKPVYMNTWSFNNPTVLGPVYNYSGFRHPELDGFSDWSQHRFGRAADIKIPGLESEEIRRWIRRNYNYLWEAGLSTIEKDTPTWVHIDTRWTGKGALFEVDYK